MGWGYDKENYLLQYTAIENLTDEEDILQTFSTLPVPSGNHFEFRVVLLSVIDVFVRLFSK